ncbi:ferritin-like domain-containing protein [Ureaplasma ceti]
MENIKYMKKSELVVKTLSEHFFRNVQLGIYYVDLASQASSMGMVSFAKYIKSLSDDKITIHKDLIFKYLTSIDQELIGNCKEVEFKKFDNARQIAKELLEIERTIRSEVSEIAGICLKEDDFESFNFWQWFVKDGLKDFDEIQEINSAFDASEDLLLIDNTIDKLISENK